MLDETRQKAANQAAEKQIEIQNRAAAYHRAFVQNESGKVVLDNWVRLHCMTPLMGKDVSLFQAGVAEGKRQLIKEILDHIAFINQEK